MTWLLALGEVLLFLYLIVEIICVFTYRRRLRKVLTVDLEKDHFSDEIDILTGEREAFFEGYRYLLEKLPEDFFKPKHRARLSRRLSSLIEDRQDPSDDTPPEQGESDDRD